MYHFIVKLKWLLVTLLLTASYSISFATNQPLASLMEKADITRGKLLFQQCGICHLAVKDGPNRTGPTLWGILNAPIAANASYRYSVAMKKAGENGGKWDEQALFEFIKSPRSYIPGTRMAWRGMMDEQDRANLILYLKSLT